MRIRVVLNPLQRDEEGQTAVKNRRTQEYMAIVLLIFYKYFVRALFVLYS